MSETSTKPYLLRAIYEWCTDNGYTPYLTVMVDARTRVPREYVKNSEIVLNIGFAATSGLKMENDAIHFQARFGGVAREIFIPVENVVAIYARENGQGMAFEAPQLPAREGEWADGATERADRVPNSATEPSPASVTLTAVPPSQAERQEETDRSETDDGPNPPKKGGRPTLTRIK